MFAAGALCAWGVGSRLRGPVLPPRLPAPRPLPAWPLGVVRAGLRAAGSLQLLGRPDACLPAAPPPKSVAGVLGRLGSASPWALLSSSQSLFLNSRPSEEEAGGAWKGASCCREAHVHCQRLLFLFFIFLTD